MKKFLQLSMAMIVVLGLGLSACSDDDEGPSIPNVEGNWALTSALLLDAPLTIKNVPTGVAEPPFADVTYEVGDDVVEIVGAALAGVACEDPTNYGTFFLSLETKSDGTQAVIFTCAAETVTTEVGTWELQQDTGGNYTILSLVVTVDGALYPIKVEEATFTAANVVGTINGYPTKVDFTKELLEPGNLQTLNTQATLTKLP